MRFKLECYELQELMKIKYGKNQKKVEDENGEFPILGTGGVMGYANKFLYDKPSVLIGRKGSISKVKYIDKPFWTVDTLFYTEINENKALPLYIYYYLSQIDFNYYNEGTTIPSLRTETLNKIEIYLPNIKVQNKIVDFFSNIDKKIELNTKIISNLEQLSQTFFEHWFIDFEFPNEEGKPYKSSGGEMVESELGEIPKGWDILKLSDITTLLKKTFNPSKTEVTEVLHFSLPAFDKNQLPTLDEVSTIKSNKWIIEENCVVFSKMNPKTPRIWLTNINEKMINVASSEFVVLQSKTVEENSFIYSLCKSNSFNEYLISNATGSTNSRQRVTPTIALSYKFPLSREIMKLYGSTIVGISEKIKDLYKECETLQQLRDTLLPKLLSGEIEIPDDLEV